MQIIGHRGARGLAPENTVAGFLKGLACNVDGIELDVRITKDGYAVLCHNPFIGQSSADGLVVAETNYSDLQEVKPDLATLDEAFVTINRRVPMHIEIKPDVPVEPVVALIKKYMDLGWTESDILCCSFSFEILKAVHQALPKLSLIVIESWSGVRASYRARKLGTKRLSMNQKWLWWGFIASMKRGGYMLSSYTLNDPKKAARWKKYGLYAVITDYPDRFTNVNEA